MGQVFWSLNMFGTFQQNTQMRSRERVLHHKQEPNDEAENTRICLTCVLTLSMIEKPWKAICHHLTTILDSVFPLFCIFHLFLRFLIGLLKSRFNFRSGVGSGKSSVEDVKHLGRTQVDVDSVGTVGTGAHSEPKDEPIKKLVQFIWVILVTISQYDNMYDYLWLCKLCTSF